MNLFNNAIRLYVMVLLAMSLGVSALAQNLNESNLTQSPYSRYGYGRLGSFGSATTRSMGDLGIAIRSNSYTVLANPASLTAIDTLTMMFSIGLDAQYGAYTEGEKSKHAWDAGFSYMAFHFPLWQNFAMSLSLTPYSMVGYTYGQTDKQAIPSSINRKDTLATSMAYNGLGGINNFMMGIGWRPWYDKMNEVNVGVNLGFLFGSIEHNAATYISSGQGNGTIVSHKMSVKGLHLGLGAQYSHRISADRSFIVGATFTPQLNLRVSTAEAKLSTDTITISDEYYHAVKNPMKLGIGGTYQIMRKLMASVEYEYTAWSKVNGLNPSMDIETGLFEDKHRFAFGVEYQPKTFSQHYFQVCRYRAGFNTSNGYTNINGATLREYGATAGMSMPVNKRSSLDFAIGYNHLAPSTSALLSEDYLTFTVGVTFNELMFFRNKLR